MTKITEKKLLELGFRKENVSGSESGTGKGYYYFALDIANGTDYDCLLITCASDERENGGFVVEFFDTRNLKYKDAETLETLVKTIMSGYAKEEKE